MPLWLGHLGSDKVDTTNPFRHAMVGEVLQSTLWQTSGPHSTPPGLGQLTQGGEVRGMGTNMAAFCMGFLEVNVFPVETALSCSMATYGPGPTFM